MSDATILTLKTMLAHLDDAKKYQSLRDVMASLPAPDLAAVFEDLPPEKLPVLFRLCPKDQAAEVFAELTPGTQQALIDALSDTELKAVIDDGVPMQTLSVAIGHSTGWVHWLLSCHDLRPKPRPVATTSRMTRLTN